MGNAYHTAFPIPVKAVQNRARRKVILALSVGAIPTTGTTLYADVSPDKALAKRRRNTHGSGRGSGKIKCFTKRNELLIFTTLRKPPPLFFLT